MCTAQLCGLSFTRIDEQHHGTANLFWPLLWLMVMYRQVSGILPSTQDERSLGAFTFGFAKNEEHFVNTRRPEGRNNYYHMADNSMNEKISSSPAPIKNETSRPHPPPVSSVVLLEPRPLPTNSTRQGEHRIPGKINLDQDQNNEAHEVTPRSPTPEIQPRKDQSRLVRSGSILHGLVGVLFRQKRHLAGPTAPSSPP